MKRQRRQRFIALSLLLVVATLLSYLGSFRGQFIFDDHDAIVANQDIQGLRPAAIRSTYGITRQVVAYTVAFNFWLGGLEPFGYHVVNLLIHMAASVVLLQIVSRLLVRSAWPRWSQLRGRRLSNAVGWISFGAAMIFALHPLQTSAVTYIIQRMESLSALFYLLMVLSAVRAFGSRHAWRWNAISVAFFGMAIFSKEHTITAPAIVLMLDRAFLSRRWDVVLRRRWPLYLAYCVPLVFMMTLLSPKLHLPRLIGLQRVSVDLSEDMKEAREHAEADLDESNPIIREVSRRAEAVPDATIRALRGISLMEFMSNQPNVLLHYLRLYVAPVNQCFDYQWQPRQMSFRLVVSLIVVVSLFVVSALVVIGPGSSARTQLATIVLSFFAIHSPRCTFQILDLAVEYRMYLPIAVLAPLSAILLYQVGLRLGTMVDPDRAFLIGLSLISILLARQTIARNQLFQSRLRMWSDCVSKSPVNARAHRTLAGALAKNGQFDEALTEIDTAVKLLKKPYLQQIDPGLVYRSMGDRHFDVGAFRDAEQAYLQAFKLNPGLPTVYWGLAGVARENEDFESAEALTAYGDSLTSASR
ncbi:MAG: tetratricopeptide repeat protein [Planctomycetota bacterium]